MSSTEPSPSERTGIPHPLDLYEDAAFLMKLHPHEFAGGQSRAVDGNGIRYELDPVDGIVPRALVLEGGDGAQLSATYEKYAYNPNNVTRDRWFFDLGMEEEPGVSEVPLIHDVATGSVDNDGIFIATIQRSSTPFSELPDDAARILADILDDFKKIQGTNMTEMNAPKRKHKSLGVLATRFLSWWKSRP